MRRGRGVMRVRRPPSEALFEGGLEGGQDD